MDEYCFDIKLTVNKEKIACLLTSAFDGSIGYWAKDLKIVEAAPESSKEIGWEAPFENIRPSDYTQAAICGGIVTVLDFEDDIVCTLSRSTITRGLDKMARDKSAILHLADIVAERDDAITADVFIQYCVFGEVKYA